MHICSAAAALIEQHGLQIDPARTVGKNRTGITLHQSLRKASGLHAGAWLGAYMNYRTTTEPYQRAVEALRAVVAGRVEHPIEMTLWAERVSQQEVVGALAAAAVASPGATVPDPAPALRPGCDPKKRISSVKISGVLVAALRTTSAANVGTRVGALTLQAAEGNPSDCTNEAFLDGLDALTPDGFVPPHSESRPVCDVLTEATEEIDGFRVPELLAQVSGTRLDTISDVQLATALSEKFERERAIKLQRSGSVAKVDR